MKTKSQKLHLKLDKACGDLVKERDGHKCRRCGGEPVSWCHIIRRSRSKAVRWNPDNTLALCRACHYWLDLGADMLSATAFIEEMIGKNKMKELVELAHDKNAKPWGIKDLENKLKELNER